MLAEPGRCGGAGAPRIIGDVCAKNRFTTVEPPGKVQRF